MQWNTDKSGAGCKVAVWLLVSRMEPGAGCWGGCSQWHYTRGAPNAGSGEKEAVLVLTVPSRFDCCRCGSSLYALKGTAMMNVSLNRLEVGVGLDIVHFSWNKTKLPENPVRALPLNLSPALLESNNYSFLGDLQESSTADWTFC